MKKYTFWFITGSQHLYGEETLLQVKENSLKIVEGLKENLASEYAIEFKALLTRPDEITELIKEANKDDTCAGLVGWMHTFSPAKMWIKGLSRLQKPFVQLHTQFNRDIPWDDIDMDFMNLNQTAHGGREFGFINSRLRMPRKIIVGHYEDQKVLKELGSYMNVAVAIAESQNLKVARFDAYMARYKKGLQMERIAWEYI